jgi:hypothetical protein
MIKRYRIVFFNSSPFSRKIGVLRQLDMLDLAMSGARQVASQIRMFVVTHGAVAFE